VGVCNSKVRLLQTSPHRCTPPDAYWGPLLSYMLSFERLVTKSKAHRMRMAAQIPSGTRSAASRVKLLVGSLVMWPAIPTTALTRTLLS
jgi:hypothetical protein